MNKYTALTYFINILAYSKLQSANKWTRRAKKNEANNFQSKLRTFSFFFLYNAVSKSLHKQLVSILSFSSRSFFFVTWLWLYIYGISSFFLLSVPNMKHSYGSCYYTRNWRLMKSKISCQFLFLCFLVLFCLSRSHSFSFWSYLHQITFNLFLAVSTWLVRWINIWHMHTNKWYWFQ